MFYDPDARSPWLRDHRFGFRCVKAGAGDSQSAGQDGVIERPIRNYDNETPVSDSEFRLFTQHFSYDPTDLGVEVREVRLESEFMRIEKASIIAAYGEERIPVYLFLPRKATPPLQTVVRFPSSRALRSDPTDPAFKPESIAEAGTHHMGNVIVRSGRAFVFPIYKSTNDEIRETLAWLKEQLGEVESR